MWSLYKTTRGVEYYVYGRAKLEVFRYDDGDFGGVVRGNGWEEYWAASDKEGVKSKLLACARLHEELPYKVEFWYGGLPVVRIDGKLCRVNHDGTGFVLENI